VSRYVLSGRRDEGESLDINAVSNTKVIRCGAGFAW
jgi:hypothetical protein